MRPEGLRHAADEEVIHYITTEAGVHVYEAITFAKPLYLLDHTLGLHNWVADWRENLACSVESLGSSLNSSGCCAKTLSKPFDTLYF